MIADDIIIERKVWLSQKERLHKVLAEAVDVWEVETSLVQLTCSTNSAEYTKTLFLQRLVDAVMAEGLLAK